MRWIAALGGVGLAGCASIGTPPGGPARTTPPAIVGVTPDSGAVNVRARSVVFTFDAVINDRADLDNLFLLSPQEGRPRISWHRERIEVRPRRGFRPNTAYSVTLLPGLTDLRGNSLKTGRTIVFSTGPVIPPYLVLGRVFDWMAERAAPRALVELIRRPDSLVYVGIADSTGQFGIGPVAEGTYTVRAIIDANNNRALDRAELWDSVAVVVAGGTSPFVELLAAPRDTIPPRMLTVTVPDSVTVAVAFDRPLHPDLRLTGATFRVVGADSVPLRVMSVLTRAQADSLRAMRDSATRAADTSARADTVRRNAARDAARRDTAAVGGPVVMPVARPSRPAPVRDLVVRVDALTPMQAGKTYRVTAFEIRGLLGRPHTSDRVINLPRARVDTTRPPVRRPP